MKEVLKSRKDVSSITFEEYKKSLKNQEGNEYSGIYLLYEGESPQLYHLIKSDSDENVWVFADIIYPRLQYMGMEHSNPKKLIEVALNYRNTRLFVIDKNNKVNELKTLINRLNSPEEKQADLRQLVPSK